MTESSGAPAHPDAVAPAVLEREMQLVRDAIAMVAAGGAARVTVAGIRFGDQLLELAEGWAREAGVRIAPLWRTDEAGLDISVERAE